MALPGSRPQHASNTFDETLAPGCLRGELSFTGGRQAVVFRLSIVFGCAPEGGDPAAVFEAIQSRVKRTVLHLKNFVRSEFNGMRDGVAMGRTPQQGAKDQHVERALQQVAFRFGFLRHEYSMPILYERRVEE